MKGVTGLIVAAALGIVGAFCNWFYLAQKSRDLEKIEFIAVAGDARINPGDKFKESDFVPVGIPSLSVGNLLRSAPLYADRKTIIGMAATRTYEPGELLLSQDLRTPPPMDVTKQLGDNERVMWIPVDTRSFVPQLFNAGNLISFVVPRFSGPTPIPAEGQPVPDRSANPSETIGPFRILALGNRLGTPETLRASGASASQENVVAIAVKIVDGNLDATGQKLSDLMRLTNFQGVQILLHPTSSSGKGKG